MALRRPLTVIMDLTERCNLRCVMCYFSAVDRLRFEPFDRELSSNGNMPVEVFERIATDLFPRASRVALACAAEPMIHPRFREIVRIAGRFRIPDLWFPTNLLALTQPTAEAIVEARVTTVAVSIDGFTRETYEAIRVGGRWERLIEKLELLNDTRRGQATGLRFIFTWMQSNRHEIAMLPEFAARFGANQIDVRYVTPAVGVDLTTETLDGEDSTKLRRELREAAEEAVRRGIRLQSYPEFDGPEDRPGTFVGRAKRRLWRIRAGLERLEYWQHSRRQRAKGCAYPGTTYVVRPNGAVSPCIFWQKEPIGFYPDEGVAAMASGEPLRMIEEGLACGEPVGSCANCDQRRDAFYRPRYRAPENLTS